MNYEAIGRVSVWLGRVPGEQVFKAYLAEQYESDESPISSFAAEFGIDWYDHDRMESRFARQGISILEMLEPASYSATFSDSVVDDASSWGLTFVNACILLYDVHYSSKLAPAATEIRFVGAYPYEMV